MEGTVPVVPDTSTDCMRTHRYVTEVPTIWMDDDYKTVAVSGLHSFSKSFGTVVRWNSALLLNGIQHCCSVESYSLPGLMALPFRPQQHA